MFTALLAVPIAAQLASAVPPDASQSQFTSPAQNADTMRFRDMDRNGDGVITRAEWRGSEQSFRVHDWNSDGILSGDEVRPGALRTGRDERSGIYDDREDTFENLDVNGNDRIERHEWHASADAFDWLDQNRDGVLSRREVVGRRAVARQNPRDSRGVEGTTGSTPGPGAQQNCDSNAARIVDDIYQQVLERPADAGSAGFAQSLASGRMTVRDIVAKLAKSDEHAIRHFWQPVVTTVYQQILNRPPDDQELQQAAASLASGERKPIDLVGRAARRAASSDEEAVRILYQRLLNREADPQGLRDFTELARREGIEAVARQIAGSAEYRRQASTSRAIGVDDAAYDEAVRSLYRHVLGRQPDPAGAQALTRTAVERGFDAVVDSMLTSAEYNQLYGVHGVPGRNTRYCGPQR